MGSATASEGGTDHKLQLAAIGVLVVGAAWVVVADVRTSTAAGGLATTVINAVVVLGLVLGIVGLVAISRYRGAKERREALVRKERAASLAAAISNSLAEGGFDAEAAATEIAGHLALAVGDACVISLFSEAGPLVPTVVRAADARLELAVRAAFPTVILEEDDPYLTGKALATSKAQQVHGSIGAVIASSRAGLTELFSAAEAQSLLVVPMRCFNDTLVPRRGQAVGVVYMVRCAPDGYSEEEVASLQDAADRAGLILAGASLHRVVEAAEQRFRTIFAEAPIGVVVVRLTGAHHFVDVNDQFCKITGYRREKLLEMTPQDLVHPADRALALEVALGLVTGSDVHLEREVGVVRADGEVIRVRLSASATNLGEGRDAIVHVEDVTERALAAAALATSEERFRSTFERSPAGLAMVSLEDTDHDVIVDANSALCTLTDRSGAELVGTSLADLFTLEQEGSARSPGTVVDALLHSNDQQLCRWALKDGAQVWGRMSAAVLPGRPRRCLLQVNDVTAQRLAEADLAYRAMHDHLTGLANRHLAIDHLRLALLQLARTHNAVAVLFVDLDLFKRVNDTMGHEAGDEVLCQLGQRLAGEIRAPDTAARLGGDEFLVVCTVQDHDAARHVVERVQQVLSRPVSVGTKTFELTASIGIAVTSNASSDPDELVRQADAAMYEAKHGGRHRWQVYNEHLHRRARQRQAVELDLRRALKHDLFRLHYQPVFDLSGRALVGAEALIRMEQPDGKLVAPGLFVGVAEDTDLIRPMTDWVLDHACAQMAQWDVHDHFHLAVNLSGSDLCDPMVTARVLDRAGAHGIPASRLVLELTEGVLIDGDSRVVRELTCLREAGARLAIDDFGTGYCSLTYLERFPVDTVKIDRSFVAGLGSNSHATAIVEAVVSLCATLGLTCIAEGIERPEQADTLRGLGCDMGQGFFFGAPVGPDEFAGMFKPHEMPSKKHIAG